MRKTLLLVLFALLQITIKAQILNPSFEDWEPIQNFEKPLHWETNQDSNFERFVKDTDAVQGNYSLKIIPGPTSDLQECTNTATAGFKLEGPVGENKLLTFFVKTKFEKSNTSGFIFFEIYGNFYAQGADAGNFRWETYDEINAFKKIKLPFDSSIADSLKITIESGSARDSEGNCIRKSISWLDEIAIEESLSAGNCISPCQVYCGILDSCVNVCSDAGFVVATDNCADAEIATLCDLDGFNTINCYSTPDGPGGLPQFCGPGTIVHNNTWVGFEPLKNGRLHLNIEIINCFSPHPSCNGLQAAVARALCSNPGNVFSGFEYETLDCANCVNQTFDLITVDAIAGVPHYIMIDGCCGDACEYTIHVIDGFEESSLEVEAVSGVFCESIAMPNCGSKISNALATAKIDPFEDPNPDYFFTWRDPFAQVIYEGPANVGTSQSSLSGVNPNTGQSYFCSEGIYSVEIKNLNDCSKADRNFNVSFSETQEVNILASDIFLSCNEPDELLLASPTDPTVIPTKHQWFKVDDSTLPPVQNQIINEVNESLSISLDDPLTGPGIYLYNMYEISSICPSEAMIEMLADTLTTSNINIDSPGILDCINNPSLQLNAASTFLIGPSSILWTSADNFPIENSSTLIPIVSQAGIYTITITNNDNGCVSAQDVEVFSNSSEVDYTIDPDPNSITINCQNENELFTIVATVNKAPNYEVIWYDGAGQIISTGTTYEGLLQNLASVTINNLDNTCSSSNEDFTIIQNTLSPDVEFIENITINCQNPQENFPDHPDFTVTWEDENNNTVDGPINQAGTYHATIIDEINFCETTASLEVNVQEDPTLTLTAQNILCFGEMNGAISIATEAGLEPFTYEWDTPFGSMMPVDLTALAVGTYSLTLTDANNCTSEQMITISQPEQLLVELSETGNQLETIIQGGTPPYTYLWNIGSTNPSINFDPTHHYTVTVTDANGCTAVASRAGCEVFCSVANTIINLCSRCDNQILADNCADAYIGTLMELDGFTSTLCGLTADGPNDLMDFCGLGTIAQNNMWIGFDVPTSTNSITLEVEIINCLSTNNACNGMQAAIVRAVCSNPGNVFEPNGYETLSCVNCATSTFALTTSDLIPGQPHYLMIDGCCGDACEFKINVIDGLPESPYRLEFVSGILCPDILNPNCCSPNSGAVVQLASIDGTPLPESHEFRWYDPNGNIMWEGPGIPNGNTIFSSLTGTNPAGGGVYFCLEGTYKVECFSPGSCEVLTLEFELGEADIPGAEFSFLNGDQLDCNQQSLSLNGTPDDPAYDILFQNWWKVDFSNFPATREFIPASSGSQTSNLVVELDDEFTGGGVYLYTYIGMNDFCVSETMVCIAVDTISPIVNIGAAGILDCDQSASIILDASASVVNRAIIDCNITLDIQAGGFPQEEIVPTNNYTLLWTSDSNQPILNEATFTPTVSQAGIYTLTIINLDNSCSASASIEVFQSATDLDFEITPDPSSITIDCNNPQVDIQFSVQTTNSNALIEWLDADGNVLATGPTYYASNLNLSSVSVTDSNSACSSTQAINYIANFEEPVIDFPTTLQLDCNLLLVDLPQNNNYITTWRDASGNIILGSTDQTGIYYAEVVDPSNGCSANASLLVVAAESLEIIVTATNLSCYQSTDGTAMVSVQNGQAPFVFSWMTPNGTASESTLNNLTAGQYDLTVTDANNCTTTESIFINEPAELTCTIDEMSQGLLASGNGGTAPYTFLWSNGEMGELLVNYAVNSNYTVSITDANGCTCTNTFFACNISIDFPTNVSLNCNNTSYTLPPTPNYNVSWTDEDGNEIQNLVLTEAGVYTALVEDIIVNCFIEHVLIITLIADPEIEISATNISCFGAMDGNIELQVSNGQEPFTYLWSTPDGVAPTANMASSGSYGITVTDSNACSAEATTIILEPEVLEAEIFLNGDNNLEVAPTGGTAAYTYLWSDNSTASIVLNPSNNLAYSVTITDANNCSVISNYISIGECEIFCSETDSYTNLCDDCGTVVASDNCIDAIPVSICTIDGFQTTTCGFTADTENELAIICPGFTSINNNLWIAFTATKSGRLHLNIEIVNCLSPSLSCSGMKAGLLRGECNISDGPELMNLDCISCVDQSFDLITVDAIAGATHFLMIDACCEDVCEIIVHLVDGGDNSNGWIAESSPGILCPNLLDPDCHTIVTPAIITLNDVHPALYNHEFTFAWYDTVGNLVKSETELFNVSTQVQTSSEGICIPGVYTIEISNAANCCLATETIELNLQASIPAIIEADYAAFDCGLSELTLIGSSSDPSLVPISQTWWKVDYSTTPPSLISIPESYGSLTSTLTVLANDPNTGVGDYLFIFTDATTICASEALITISESQSGDAPQAVIETPGTISCFGVIGLELDASGSILNGNNVSILWTTINGGMILNENTLNPTVFEIGEYTLTLTNEDTGCSDSATVLVTAVEDLTYEIIPSTSSPVITCRLDTFEFEVVYDSLNNYEIEWLDGSGFVLQTGPNYSGTDLVSTVTILDVETGCTVEQSFSYTEDQNNPDVFFPSSLTLECGVSIVLPDDSIYLVEWYGFDGDLLLDNIVTEQGTYIGIVTDETNGCTSTVEINVVNEFPPSISVDATIPSCFGFNDGAIQLTVDDGTELFFYTWSEPYSDSTGSTLSMIPAGTYEVTITDSLGCFLLQTIILSSPDELVGNVITNMDGMLEANAVGGSTPYNYLWSTGETSAVNEYAITGEIYQLTVTDANGCTAVAEGQLITSSESAGQIGSDIKVYPNPTSDVINVDYKGLQIKWSSISVYTVIGQEVYSLIKEGKLSKIELTELPAGIYFIEIKTDLGTVVKRIIKN